MPVLLGQASVDLLRGPADESAAWVDFELRSAEYYGLLAELTERRGSGPDPAAAQGFLPEALAERVRAQDLDETHRRVSLRGYQSFGARFALAQRRVILGDEMGLGKTIQALAALAHLAAQGQRHFLVVCPAGCPDQLDPRDRGAQHPARGRPARPRPRRRLRGLAGRAGWP